MIMNYFYISGELTNKKEPAQSKSGRAFMQFEVTETNVWDSGVSKTTYALITFDDMVMKSILDLSIGHMILIEGSISSRKSSANSGGEFYNTGLNVRKVTDLHAMKVSINIQNPEDTPF